MIRSSFANHKNKVQILVQFHNNQEFMQNNFSFKGSLKCLDKKLTKPFCYFFCAMLVSYAGIILFMELYFSDQRLYFIQYVLLTVFMHAQAFQILAYSKLIRFQLELFNSIATEDLDQKGEEKFRRTLLLIFEFSDQTNKTFSS